MNNNNNSNRNNNNNNRRRGRGNNRPQGGGNQNRIDSRARGNAPQMLDKYRKLAQDAQHNGDRVQAEYYLQFADHYFRVIADSRPRPEEQRGNRRDEREFAADEDGADEDDFDGRNARDDRSREERPRDDRPREDRPRDERAREDRPRDNPGRNGERQRQAPRRDDEARTSDARGEGARDENAAQAEPDAAMAYEPAENPFTRPSRGREGRRPRARSSNRDETQADAGSPADETDLMTGDGGEIDASALPPSFSAGSDAEGEGERPVRKLPPRRRRKPAEEGGEGDNLTAVG